MSVDLKKGQFFLIGDNPMQITERTEVDMPTLTPDQERTIRVVGKAVRAYQNAVAPS